MTQGRPGEWPVNEPVDLDGFSTDEVVDELYVKRVSELARRELVLGSIRANLLEQPTPSAVMRVARSWAADVTALGDEVAKAKRNPG
ncbi:hypothetical protein ACIRU8_10235 [Streptomyces sp. NPDC101175]|uniref:hypothetical protein n=1 Tax=Streptomyces sp. NPDC101175 TaxID=3366123 RepID=UPI003838B618